ncbi:MAG: hypothetical protein ACTHK8_00995 [Ginsengibacter sp.]
MSFIFRDWKEFILQCLESLNEHSSIEESKKEEWLNKSVEWKETLEKRVIEYMLSKAKQKEKKQYVKLLEIMVVSLLDKIYLSHLCSANNSINKAFSIHLKNFLFFLRENFNDYFDCNQKMPQIIFEASSKELSELADSICKGGSSASTRCRYIIRFIAKSFKVLCDKRLPPAFAEMNYHLELANELLQLGILTSEEKLKKTLFYFNYNHIELCELLGNQLMHAVRKQRGKSSQMLMLLLEQKKISQYPMKQGYCLHSHLPSLKDQVIEWINEEMNFLKMEEFAPADTATKTFVHVPFRGTEIYLLHKAFVDSGGAAGETYKSLFEKTASHLINNNQKGFSTESLQKNADKVNYEAKDNVKRFLQKMIRNIDSY